MQEVHFLFSLIYNVVHGMPVSKHSLVKRFMKAAFNIRPALLKYNDTWDVNLLLNYFKILSPVSKISVKMLTRKLSMLLLLLSGQRGQTIHLFSGRSRNGRSRRPPSPLNCGLVFFYDDL